MKIKFDSDDYLPLNKQIKFPTMMIVVRSAAEEDCKFYPQFFLRWMFVWLKNTSEGTDINKTNESKEYDICHYWYFLSKNFNYEP